MAQKADANCAEIFEMLSRYLDLDLPPQACRMLEEHLAGCSPCVAFVASLRGTVELCRHFKASEMPGPLRDDARRQLLDAYTKALAAKTARARSGGSGF